jgi:hypothetical protein
MMTRGPATAIPPGRPAGPSRHADQWAKPGSKKRRVYDLLLDRHWHTSSELDAAFRNDYPEGGWCWDGAKAQLKATLERCGGTVISENISGRHESRHRMVLPGDAKLSEMLERSEAQIAERRQAVRGPAQPTLSTTSSGRPAQMGMDL